MKDYEIDLQNDVVLKELGFTSCPETGEKLDQKLNEWTTRYNDLNQKNSSSQVQDVSNNLTSLLNQLPVIQSERERIEKHTNICSGLFEVIKQRLIDEFHALEDEIMEKGSLSGEEKQQF